MRSGETMQLMTRLSLCALFSVLAFAAQSAFAQGYSITGTTQQTIDFTGFAGTGVVPSPTSGELDSDEWRFTGFSDATGTFGGSFTSGDHARGTSTSTTGGLRGMDIGSGNIALGIRPGSSDWTPGTATLRIQNNTGSAITSLALTYDVIILNDQDRSSSFNFQHSGDDSTYTMVSSQDETSTAAQDSSPAFTSTSKSVTINFGTPLATSAVYYLQWYGDDVGGSGSRDILGIDNIALTATTSGGASPTITTNGTLNAFTTTAVSTPSSEQSYTVSGTNLTADIAIAAPSEFEISTTSGSNFGSNLTLTQSGGSVSSTTIFVRYNPASGTSHSGNVAHTSSGATQRDIAVSGSVTTMGGSGNVLFSEDWESYTVATDLPLGTTWNGHSGSGAPTVETGASSKVLQMTEANGQDVNAAITGGPYSTGTIYAGMTLRFTANPGGSYFTHFNASGFRCRVFASESSGVISLGVSSGSSSATATHSAQLALNTDYRLVMRYNIDTGESAIWVDPTSESSTNAIATDSGSGSISEIAFRQSSGIGTIQIDDVLVGDGFGAVVGMVSMNPTISINGSLGGFLTNATGTPSAEQSYEVSGSNLSADIALSVAAPFEISSTSGSGFGSSLTLTQSGGDVANTTIYVRYNPTTGTSHTGMITHTSSGATQRDVNLSGAVVSGTFFSEDFQSYTTGMDLPTGTGMTWFTHSGDGSGAPAVINGATSNALELSDSRGADVSTLLPGAPLSASSVSQFYYGFDLVMTSLPTSGGGYIAHFRDDQFDYSARLWVDLEGTNFKVGISNNSGGATEFLSTQLSLNTIYRVVVRYDLTSGESTVWIDPANETSTGATATASPQVIAIHHLSLRQASNIGTMELDNMVIADNFSDARGTAQTGPVISIGGSLSPFSTTATGTPSMEQDYTVSGSNLAGDVTITTAAPFEISTTSGSGFSSMVTLTQSAGTLAATSVYVRYNPTMGASHTGMIDHTSMSANTRTLSVSGIVSTGASGYPVAAGGPQTIDLSTYAGEGLANPPAPGQLNSSHWRVKGLSDGDSDYDQDNTTGDFARQLSSGNESGGGLYAFNTGSIRAVGVQPTSSDFTPGSIDLRLSNQTGGDIDTILVAYDIWVLNNGARSSSLNFLHSGIDMDTAYLQVASLDFTTPEAADGNPAWTKTERLIVITLGTALPDGGSYFLRFASDDVAGSGSRDEFGIANITLEMTLGGSGGNTPPSLRLAAGSSFTGNDGGPFSLTAETGMALSMAELELFDAEGDAIDIVSVTPATANGIFAPSTGMGFTTGDTLSFTGTPATSTSETFDILVRDLTGQRTVRVTISSVTAGNALPTLALAQTGNSLFGGSGSAGWVYPAAQGVALVDANLELFDSDGGAVTIVSVTPSVATNGITPPMAGAGMSGDGISFTGTPTATGTTTFTFVLSDAVGDMATVDVSFDVIDPASVSAPSVVINEIAYESANQVNSVDAEFIELHNTTGTTISLAGWKLSTSTSTITFPTGTLIQADGYLVISNKLNRADFRSYYGVQPNLAIDNSNPVNVANMDLANTGGVLGLQNAAGDLVDMVGWGAAPRAASATGLPGFSGTAALLLASATVDGSLARSPNGMNDDLISGQRTTEDGENSFSAAPWSPGMNNDLPVIVLRRGTAVIPRSTTNPNNFELTLTGMSEADLTANPIGITVRYISTNGVDVSYAYNSSLSTYADLMESGLNLPANSSGNMGGTGMFDARTDSLSGSVGESIDPITSAMITVSGVAALRVTIFDATLSQMIENNLVLTVIGELVITTPQMLPTATAGGSYSAFLNAFGGTPGYTWSAVGLPAWLSLSTDGELSATSAQAGMVTFTATVTDSVSATASQDFTVTVSGGSPTDPVTGGTSKCSIGGESNSIWLMLVALLGALALFAAPRKRQV